MTDFKSTYIVNENNNSLCSANVLRSALIRSSDFEEIINLAPDFEYFAKFFDPIVMENARYGQENPEPEGLAEAWGFGLAGQLFTGGFAYKKIPEVMKIVEGWSQKALTQIGLSEEEKRALLSSLFPMTEYSFENGKVVETSDEIINRNDEDIVKNCRLVGENIVVNNPSTLVFMKPSSIL